MKPAESSVVRRVMFTLGAWLGQLGCCVALALMLAQVSFAQPLLVGSKRFTESYILGEVVSQVVTAAGHDRVVLKSGLGNTGILLSALRSGEIDLYPEYTGTGLNAGAALTSHPGVDKLTFTGSTEVGKQIGKAAMDNMTRVTLELGGKSPTIVLADADLQVAAAGAASAIFFNQGQVCCAGSRLYVQRKHFDNVVADIAAIANAMKLGNGLDPSVEMGPLISARQQARVYGYIEKGRESGATIACGGEQFGPGFFVKPTVIVDVDQKHSLVQEEIFGPVLVAMPFDDIDQAVHLANDNSYGLGASIWSNDMSAVHRMIPRIKSGSVWVNCHSALDPALPFGGHKLSGIGREMGGAAIEHYTELKTVMIKL